MTEYKLYIRKCVIYTYESGSMYDEECNVCKDGIEVYLCRLENITEHKALTMSKVFPENVGYIVMELLKKIKWPASLEIDTDIDMPLRPKWDERVESHKDKVKEKENAK